MNGLGEGKIAFLERRRAINQSGGLTVTEGESFDSGRNILEEKLGSSGFHPNLACSL